VAEERAAEAAVAEERAAEAAAAEERAAEAVSGREGPGRVPVFAQARSAASSAAPVAARLVGAAVCLDLAACVAAGERERRWGASRAARPPDPGLAMTVAAVVPERAASDYRLGAARYRHCRKRNRQDRVPA